MAQAGSFSPARRHRVLVLATRLSGLTALASNTYTMDTLGLLSEGEEKNAIYLVLFRRPVVLPEASNAWERLRKSANETRR
jgi:hypothetical protein